MDSQQPTLKVLVVDDSAVYRKQVEQTLAYHPSYETFLACDGEEALRILPRNSTDYRGFGLDDARLFGN